jgi:hypothetical protein
MQHYLEADFNISRFLNCTTADVAAGKSCTLLHFSVEILFFSGCIDCYFKILFLPGQNHTTRGAESLN